MSVDEGGRSPETLVCNACGQQCGDPRKLAVHMERHRPVDPPTLDKETGREMSHPCSAGCGRNFLSLAQYREHAPICDGQQPLPPFLDNRKGEVPKGRAMECPECRTPFGDADGFSVHLERHREVLPVYKDPKTGEVMTRPCPKGCPRNFLSKRDYKEHSELCDGSPPLPTGKAKAEEPLIVIDDDQKPGKTFEMAPEIDLSKTAAGKEGEAGMFTCTDCEKPKKFTHEAWYSKHMKKVHGKNVTPKDGAAAPRAARRPADPEPESQPPRPAAPSAAGTASSASDMSVGGLKQKANDLRRRADRLEEIATAVDLLVKEAQSLL